MLQYDMLATDLDGTLTNEKKELTERTKKAVWAACEAGMHVALASGRPVAGCKRVADWLELTQRGGYILAFNGGQIIDCKSGELLYSKDVDLAFVPDIIRIAHQFDVVPLTYEGDTVITEQPDDVYVQRECFINAIEAKGVDDLAEYVTWSVPKFLIVADHEKLLPVRDALIEQFGDRLSVYFSEPFFLEVMAQGVDKAKALQALSEKLDIPAERMIACGDGPNDISMIEYAGLGAAMDNASDAVKKFADRILPSNEEDGVAVLLEEVVS